MKKVKVMKKLSLLYCGDLRQIQGVNKVTENLIFGRENFLKEQIDFKYVFSYKQVIECENYCASIIGNNVNNVSYRWNRHLRTYVKNLKIFQNKYADYYKIYRNFNKPGMEVVKKYFNSNVDSDVIIFQDFLTAYYFIKENKKKVKTILILHSTEEPLSQLLGSYPRIKDTYMHKKLNEMLDYVIKNIDKVVFVSKQPLKDMESKYNRKFDCVYNGIEDIKTVKKNEKQVIEKYKFVVIGSINHRKGQDMLVEAVGLLDESIRNNLEINIVGDGPQLALIKKQVQDKGLKNNFVFWGARNDVESIINDMDVFILPSRNEALPISLIEAMRASMPIIASDVGGISEMIEDKYNGILIQPEVESIKVALTDVLNNKFDIKQMGKNSRKKYMESFNRDSMVNNYLKIINSTFEMQGEKDGNI